MLLIGESLLSLHLDAVKVTYVSGNDPTFKKSPRLLSLSV